MTLYAAFPAPEAGRAAANAELAQGAQLPLKHDTAVHDGVAAAVVGWRRRQGETEPSGRRWEQPAARSAHAGA